MSCEFVSPGTSWDWRPKVSRPSDSQAWTERISALLPGGAEQYEHEYNNNVLKPISALGH